MELRLEDVTMWRKEFEDFCEVYRPFFGRVEVQKQAQTYIHALMSSLERKNGWTVAESQNLRDPQPVQRLLRTASWQRSLALQQMQQQVKDSFSTSDGIFLLDESSVLKDGSLSVGVARQYCGSVGKVEKCQVGVYLAYTSTHGHAFLDCRLYLPIAWIPDQERRKRTHVPDDVVFKTKPELAWDMLFPLFDADFPGEWVAGDSVYGNSPYLRNKLKERGKKFVLGINGELPVWTKPPWLHTKKTKQGERKWEVSAEGTQKRSACDVAKALKERKWKQLKVAEGSKGWRIYEFAAKRVYVSEDGEAGACLWLLVRRGVGESKEVNYFLCHAPVNVALLTLARVSASRWRVEQCFEEGKGEAGLDQYQVRSWEGWHRHMLFSMLAHLFLAKLKRKFPGDKSSDDGLLTVPEIRRLLEIALPLPVSNNDSKWRWSLWRRRHNQKALRSHFRRRGHQSAA